MDRLGSPPAAALLEAGRGGTAGGAEITSWASMPLSECHFKPPCAFFSIGWSFFFLPDTKLCQGSRAVCRGGNADYRDLMTTNQDSPTKANASRCSQSIPHIGPLSGKGLLVQRVLHLVLQFVVVLISLQSTGSWKTDFKEGITDVCVYLVRTLALLHLNQFKYPGKSGVLGTNLYLHKKLVLVSGKVNSSFLSISIPNLVFYCLNCLRSGLIITCFPSASSRLSVWNSLKSMARSKFVSFLQ